MPSLSTTINSLSMLILMHATYDLSPQTSARLSLLVRVLASNTYWLTIHTLSIFLCSLIHKHFCVPIECVGLLRHVKRTSSGFIFFASTRRHTTMMPPRSIHCGFLQKRLIPLSFLLSEKR